MLRVISIPRCTPAGFKLTKLFGIDDFSVAKDFGKVFIIIIYCFYNYYYYYDFCHVQAEIGTGNLHTLRTWHVVQCRPTG